MIGNRLRALREMLAFNQKSFAEKLEVAPAVMNHYENGNAKMNSVFFERLQKETNVNLNWLICGVGDVFISGEPKLSKEHQEMKNILSTISNLCANYAGK